MIWILLALGTLTLAIVLLARAQRSTRPVEVPGEGPTGHRFSGDSPVDAIPVATPAVIEGRAQAIPCVHCGGAVRLDEHAADTRGGVRVRIARVQCDRCGKRSEVYFRLEAQAPN